MAKTSDTEAIENDLKLLFEASGIEKVVYVDDIFALKANVDEVIAICWSFRHRKQEIQGRIQQFKNFNFDDLPTLSDYIRGYWDECSEKDKEQIYRDCILIKGEADDFGTKNKLHEIISNVLSNDGIIEQSLEGWKNNKDKLLEEANNQNMLFLIDEDFSKEEGGRPKEGLDIISEIVKSNKNNFIKCGLLSHNYSGNTEIDKWEKYSKEYSLDKERFFLIAKKKLNTDEKEFLNSLKLLILNSDCNELKKITQNILENSHKDAISEIEKINIVDFDKIIFKKSKEEGVWEHESLFRLFYNFHTKTAHREARKSDELKTQSDKIRKISGLPYGNEDSTKRKSKKNKSKPPKGNTWKIEREEIYEPQKYINTLHLPIELGDIFEDEKTRKKYILIAQPCDLMIRSDGKRALTHAPIGEIKEIESGKFDYELPFFNHNDGKSAYVSFRTVDVDLFILDLCVYNDAGMAKIQHGQSYPGSVTPCWEERYKDVSSIFKKVVEKSKKLQSMNLDLSQLNSLACPPASVQEIFAGEINLANQELKYACKRISRLAPNYAQDLLRSYGNYICRVAK